MKIDAKQLKISSNHAIRWLTFTLWIFGEPRTFHTILKRGEKKSPGTTFAQRHLIPARAFIWSTRARKSVSVFLENGDFHPFATFPSMWDFVALLGGECAAIKMWFEVCFFSSSFSLCWKQAIWFSLCGENGFQRLAQKHMVPSK